MKRKDDSIEKTLRRKLCITLALYVVIGFVLTLLLEYIFSQFQNPVAAWLYWRMDMLFIVYIILGFCVIFYEYWKRPWAYLNEIVEAAQTIYEQNDRTIVLSEPLKEIADQMNRIKMSVLVSKQAAKEAEDKKNELVMYLAHDIRTPLTTVIGYLSLLQEAPDMPAAQRVKYVGIALDKAERLETLINELFEITRYNAKTVPLQTTKLDLHCMLVQLLDEFYPALSARGNTTVLDADENLFVMADPEKLARALNNLLQNAAAYSDPHTEISVAAHRQNASIVIAIQNHGKTLSPEELKAVFEKFSRLDGARLSNTGGAGLGLSIAEEIIRLHGGEITASSQNNTICFTVTLPFSA